MPAEQVISFMIRIFKWEVDIDSSHYRTVMPLKHGVEVVENFVRW